MDFVLTFIGLCIIAVGIIVGVSQKKKGGSQIVLPITILAGVVMIGFSCVVSVPAGHTGVVTTFGSVEDYTYEAGLHVKAPWQKVVKMDNRVQKNTLSMACFSSDIQEVTLSYTINYQIKKSDAQTIYRTIGESYYDTVIEPCISESVKIVTAKYSAENLIADRSKMADEIEDALKEKLAGYNIELVSTSIENMDFTDAFEAAVEEKQVAEQNKLKAATQAEQSVIEAEAAAKIRTIEADAYAYEVKTKAEAEAEANQKIAQSLTQELIDYTYASKWNGEMPLVTGGSSILDVSALLSGDEVQ